MKNFLLGCNFWDSKSGTDMWINFDEDSLREDLDALQSIGVNTLRCFPNWRDFQPVIALRGWRGNFKEYRLTGDRLPENEYYIDPVMIERFKIFARLAEERGISLIVSVLTGWMSGRLFYPPLLEGKNLFKDPEALVFEEKFVRGFVKYTKDIPNIVMWDLGNECNCLGYTDTRSEGYLWTVTIRNAILASDSSRKISSGMHGLDFDANGKWPIADQGEICDMLSTHPYPSPTIGGDIDNANKLRTTMLPTAQCAFYEGISHKPVMIQEQGVLSNMIANRKCAADFLRANICSSIANGHGGYLWWCAHEHLHLTRPPYTWSMIERELGILDHERVPKPVGTEMKRLSEIIEKLPEIPEKVTDSVIVCTNEQNQWGVSATSFILAKRAGLTPKICSFFDRNIPVAPIYFLPSIMGWAPIYAEPYNELLRRVHDDGATLLVSTGSGFICEVERVTGLTSLGMKKGGRSTMSFAGKDYGIAYNKKFTLESIGAKVLARDSEGDPVFCVNEFGKGKVYFLSFPLESMLWDTQGAYDEGKTEYSDIYREICGNILAEKPILSGDPDVSLTVHPDTDGSILVIAVNYTNKDKDSKYTVSDGYTVVPVLGDMNDVKACDMAICRLIPSGKA